MIAITFVTNAFITLCMMCNFSCYCCCLLTFFQINLFKILSETFAIRMSNSLGPDQDRHYVGPDLGPNCLQRLSAPPAMISFFLCFMLLLFSSDFFKISLFKILSDTYTIRVSNSLGPDQDRHYVGLDLGPNCLHRLSAPLATKELNQN